MNTKRRNTRQRKEGGKWIKQFLRLAIYIRDNFTCIYCGKQADLSLDHITPYSKGGADTPNNLVTCCVHCNRKRGNKAVEDFATFSKVVVILEQLTLDIRPFVSQSKKEIKIHGGYTPAKNSMMERI